MGEPVSFPRWRGGALLLLAGAVAVVLSPRVGQADEPLRNVIDAGVRRVWEREKISPPPLADDAVFLRRVGLDLCGVIPTADEARAFLDDPNPAKRSQWIDRLLASPRYAQHQADVWDMVYFGRNPPGYDADKRQGFQTWLREAFAKNMPYDQMARTILRAEGNTAEQGAPMYLIQYDRRPEDAAVAVSQTFLGVQLQCARCHDHPYEDWKQLDFFGMAAFFSRLQSVKAGKAGQLEKVFLAEMNTGEVKFSGPAAKAAAGKDGEPVKPKFLLAAALDEPDLSKEFKDEKRPKEGEPPAAPKFSRKEKLAEWIAAADNPYFARAVVNRVWAQYLGRGLVHPVDNMSPANSPSHPELLAALTKEFVAHKFDLKWLTREICHSQTYQLAASGATTDALPRWFERARTRPLSAEELVESWRVATGYDEVVKQGGKQPEGRFHGLTWDYVRRFFGESVTGTGDFQGGLSEHLYLNNGELDRLLTSEKGGLVDFLTKSPDGAEAKIERLFLATLSRRPSPEEREKFAAYLGGSKEEAQQRAKEALWALLTCSEFRFNH